LYINAGDGGEGGGADAGKYSNSSKKGGGEGKRDFCKYYSMITEKHGR
jgi:hypothetical protein